MGYPIHAEASYSIIPCSRIALFFLFYAFFQACQSCELDLLIPLQFGISKLVMVGDPEQLRSTVLSKVQYGTVEKIRTINSSG